MIFYAPQSILLTFFSGKKVTKNLVTRKTRLFTQAFIWFSVLLFSPFLFSCSYFLSLILKFSVLFFNEIGN